MPFYDVEDAEQVKRKVRRGQIPYIDPKWKKRNLAERKIVEAIEKCWEYDPDKRLSAYEILEILREGVEKS